MKAEPTTENCYAPPLSTASNDARIHADRIRLTFEQTPTAIVTSLCIAAVFIYLLWSFVDARILMIWMSGLVLLSLLRSILFFRYQRHACNPQQVKRYGRWNVIGIGLSGMLWGSTMVVMFPAQSIVHQLCMLLFLGGMIAAAASFAAVMTRTFLFFSLPILVPLEVRFLTAGDHIHLLVGLLAALFWIMMFFGAKNHSSARRQLIIAKNHLADCVADRTRALETANQNLQAEIKERWGIEERLRQERDRLEVLTSTIGAGLAVISKKCRMLWANRIFEEYFGEVKGKLCHETHCRQDGVCSDCGARMIFDQGYEKVVREQKRLDIKGTPLWFQVITTPIRNSQGRLRAVLELVLPITDQKSAEAARQKLSRQLEEARKTEAIATLAGGIAHQFNNALAVITGNIELLEYSYGQTAEIKNYSRPIANAAEKMTRLTNQLLAYAQGGKYKEQITDLNQEIETTLSYLQHTIPANVTITPTRDSDRLKVNIDVTQIQMVLSAVISNAVEAMDPQTQSKINIACSRRRIDSEDQAKYGDLKPGNYVALTVMDNGMGMDRDTVERIFDPFFSTKFEGRGLGMAAVYGIIKNHGGHIQVKSEPGMGSQVSIYLPAVQSGARRQPDKDRRPTHGSGTILMIEDDPAIIEVNRTLLNRIGYQVLTATTARKAMDLIIQSDITFDVALLDLVLPDMDGAAIYPVIRQHRPSAKVIICSGYGLDEVTQSLLDAGADDFIQKPFTLNRISEKLRQVMYPNQR